YSLTGAMGSGLVGYAIGNAVGRTALERRFPRAMDAVQRYAGREGAASVAVLRLVPVAPYSVVNLCAGAAGVPLRGYLGGTRAGLVPGALAVSFAEESVTRFLRDPGWKHAGVA